MCSSHSIECLLAVTKQLEQRGEQVDEVKVQAQRAHDGRLRSKLGIADDSVVAILDPLGVVGGQTSEDTEIANCSALEARNRLTRAATMMPIRPINRNVPQPVRSLRVV